MHFTSSSPYKFTLGAEEVAKGLHYLASCKAVGYLVDQAEPAPYMVDVSRCWEGLDSLHVLLGGFDTNVADHNACKLNLFLGEGELRWREHHTSFVAM